MKLLALLSTTALLLLSPLTLAAPLDTTPAATSDLTPIPATTTTTTTATTTTDQGSSPPQEEEEGGGSGNKPAAIQAVNYGAPRCKSAALEDLCISGNAGAYCDGNGFHCNFMASCKGVCWCE